MSQNIINSLRCALKNALCNKTKEKITEDIKKSLEILTVQGDLDIPNMFKYPADNGYARRLLFKCPNLGYTAVVMAWGPKQGTKIHDHDGLWCVECVLEGEIEVVQYKMDLCIEDDIYSFTETERSIAGRGEAGALIPPSEFHTIKNNQDVTAITLHIYEGELDHCNIFNYIGDFNWKKGTVSVPDL